MRVLRLSGLISQFRGGIRERGKVIRDIDRKLKFGGERCRKDN